MAILVGPSMVSMPVQRDTIVVGTLRLYKLSCVGGKCTYTHIAQQEAALYSNISDTKPVS